MAYKFTITDCSYFDKRCSGAHFVSFLSYYFCKAWILSWPAWGKTNGNRIFLWFLVIFLKNAGWIGCKTLYALFMQFYNWPFYTCRIPNQLIQLLLLMMLEKKSLVPKPNSQRGQIIFVVAFYNLKKPEFSWDFFCPRRSLLNFSTWKVTC